jgi:hypothetical protein
MNRREFLLASTAAIAYAHLARPAAARPRFGGVAVASSGSATFPTTMTLVNDSGSTSVPAGTPTQTFGWVFRDGDVPPTQAPVFTVGGVVQPYSAGLQRYYPSGCLMRCSFVLRPTFVLGASASQAITISAGGSWPASTGWTLASVVDPQNLVVDCPPYPSGYNGRSSAHMWSVLKSTDPNVIRVEKWLDGAAGTAWHVHTNMAATQGGTADGMLRFDHYIYALADGSGALGGFRWCGALRQPCYNNTNGGVSVFFQPPSNSNPTSGVYWQTVGPGGVGTVATPLTWSGADGNNFASVEISATPGGNPVYQTTSPHNWYMGANDPYGGGGQYNTLPAVVSNLTFSIQGSQTSTFTASLIGTTMTVSAIANGPVAVVVTASLSGTTMDVTGVLSGGPLAVQSGAGAVVIGNGIPAGTYIAAFGTGTGGTGTYTLSQSCTTESVETVSVCNAINLTVGTLVYGTGIPAGTYIQSLGSGTTGGIGTYTLSQSCTTESAETINANPASDAWIGGVQNGNFVLIQVSDTTETAISIGYQVGNQYTPTDAGTATLTPVPLIQPFGRIMFKNGLAKDNFFQGTGSLSAETTARVTINRLYWQSFPGIPPYDLSLTGTAEGGQVQDLSFSYPWYPGSILNTVIGEPGIGDHYDIGVLPTWVPMDWYNQSPNSEFQIRALGLVSQLFWFDIKDTASDRIPALGDPTVDYGLHSSLADSPIQAGTPPTAMDRTSPSRQVNRRAPRVSCTYRHPSRSTGRSGALGHSCASGRRSTSTSRSKWRTQSWRRRG